MKQHVLTDGQRTALRQLVLSHQGRIRAFLCRYSSNPDDLDDVSQDVFLGIVERCEELSLRTDSEIAAYLRGVARNLMRARWRKQGQDCKRREGIVQFYCEKEMMAALDDTTTNSEAMLMALQECVGKLADTARKMVRLHFFAGATLAKIAGEMGRSHESVRMTMFRIRIKLRVCIKDTMSEVVHD